MLLSRLFGGFCFSLPSGAVTGSPATSSYRSPSRRGAFQTGTRTSYFCALTSAFTADILWLVILRFIAFLSRGGVAGAGSSLQGECVVIFCSLWGEGRRSDGWRVGFTQRHTDTMAYPPALVDRFLVCRIHSFPREGRREGGGGNNWPGCCRKSRPSFNTYRYGYTGERYGGGGEPIREEKSRDTNSYRGVLEKGNLRIRAFIWKESRVSGHRLRCRGIVSLWACALSAWK